MVNVEELVEWRLAGETEVLGENLPQRHYVLHKSHLTGPGFEIAVLTDDEGRDVTQAVFFNSGLWGYWHCGHSWPVVPASGDSEDDCGEADGM
jgi:hypothetical protein